MKGKCILFVFILLISWQSFSQVPGYMGKRFTIGYDIYFAPAFIGPGLKNAGDASENSFGFNSTHCINLDYTIKSRINLCLTFQYLKTGVAYRGTYGELAFGSGINRYPDEIEYIGNFSDPAKLSSFNIGLGFKRFNKGRFAPLGFYQKFEFLLLFETLKYNHDKFSQYGSAVSLGTGSYNYTNFALAYTIGKQRVFFDKLILDYGFRMGTTSYLLTQDHSNDFASFAQHSSSVEGYFGKDAASRLFRQQLWNIHIGIGFLAF